MAGTIRCTSCGWEAPLQGFPYHCPRCDGILLHHPELAAWAGPGPTDTPLIPHCELPGDEARRRLKQHTPLGRLLQPADVAPLMLLLAAQEAHMVTDASVVVGGGLSAAFNYGGGLVQTEGSS